jgi:hypothetical protein
MVSMNATPLFVYCYPEARLEIRRTVYLRQYQSVFEEGRRASDESNPWCKSKAVYAAAQEDNRVKKWSEGDRPHRDWHAKRPRLTSSLEAPCHNNIPAAPHKHSGCPVTPAVPVLPQCSSR